MVTPEMWVEIDGPFRLRVKLATIALLTLGLVLFMAWIMWDQNQLIASQQGEIKRLQEYIRDLEERLGILNQIQSYQPTLFHEAAALAHAIQEEARRYDLDWRLLLAIIRVESRFNPRAKSPKGALGLMQVMPATFAEVAKELGLETLHAEQLLDVRFNVRVGTHYLSTLVRRFVDLEKALQAYYLGPSRIGNGSDEWTQLGRQYVEAVRLSHGSP